MRPWGLLVVGACAPAQPNVSPPAAGATASATAVASVPPPAVGQPSDGSSSNELPPGNCLFERCPDPGSICCDNGSGESRVPTCTALDGDPPLCGRGMYCRHNPCPDGYRCESHVFGDEHETCVFASRRVACGVSDCREHCCFDAKTKKTWCSEDRRCPHFGEYACANDDDCGPLMSCCAAMGRTQCRGRCFSGNQICESKADCPAIASMNAECRPLSQGPPQVRVCTYQDVP